MRKPSKPKSLRIPHSAELRHKIAAGHWFANNISDKWYFQTEGCASPIENLFIAALRTISAVQGDCAIIYADKPLDWLRSYVSDHGMLIGIQTPIGPYRVDFAIVTKNRLTVVECDGHAYHSKSKKFAARDKGRDRVLAEHGATVLRFTGSELWADSFKCAEQALKIASAPNAKVQGPFDLLQGLSEPVRVQAAPPRTANEGAAE